jgi:dCTP diphosphatase
MTHPNAAGVGADELQLGVVICGSFHRRADILEETCSRFVEAGAAVLSPTDLDFVEERGGFLLAADEIDHLPEAIEERHLNAMRTADFMWLHAPDGYVGRSAAMELGFAHALGLTVYASTEPEDVALRGMVELTTSPEKALAASTPLALASRAPTGALIALQQYYDRASRRRGWSDETAEDALRLLAGEIDELSQALRATGGLAVAVDGEDPTLELADVALYVVHVANILQIDLGTAISMKERINAERFPVKQIQTV